jgi:hypothetical protein
MGCGQSNEEVFSEEEIMSVLETLKALDEQRAQLLEGAKKEALEKAHMAIAELKELGFDYTLIERSRLQVAPGQRKGQFETEPPKRQASMLDDSLPGS